MKNLWKIWKKFSLKHNITPLGPFKKKEPEENGIFNHGPWYEAVMYWTHSTLLKLSVSPKFELLFFEINICPPKAKDREYKSVGTHNFSWTY